MTLANTLFAATGDYHAYDEIVQPVDSIDPEIVSRDRYADLRWFVANMADFLGMHPFGKADGASVTGIWSNSLLVQVVHLPTHKYQGRGLGRGVSASYRRSPKG